MGKYLGPERRYVRRHRIGCVSILYKRPRAFALFMSSYSDPCDASDISWRGVRFYARNKMRAGATLDIAFDCIGDFGLDPSSPPIKAKVVWQQWSDTHNAWRTGVVFHDLRDSERDAILKMIEGSVAFDRRHYEEFEGVK